MTEYRIVTAKYDPSGVSATDPIYKGNYGNVLRLVDFPEGMIPETFEMHFSVGSGNAKTQIGTNNEVQILDECLTKAVPITAWLFLHDAVTDGETKHEIRIPVKPKDNVTDAEPTPVEQSVITQVIAALNDGVTRSEAAQEAAEAAQEAAEGYAESAGNSAITATDAASTATSAQTAVETAARNAAASATDANASREAADQSATNAGTSERNAAASASAAQAAKEGAETAQSNAEASEASASESATDAAQSAGAAAQSATDAAGSASAAAGSASSASGSASSAAQSATDAAGSASAASGAASNASTSASNAAASATAAAGSASQAAQTVAGIETAGAAQVQAVNNAGTTQVAAVNAKGQEVLDSIPADYSELSGDVNSLKSAINDKADIIVSSASGAIASFSDGADNLPVKSLSVAIEPVQDLHRYDSPWPAGGGKNLFGGEYGTKWILPTPLSISAGDSLAISASVPASGNSQINIYTGENGATRYFNAGLNDTVDGRKVRIATFTEDITITAFLMDVAECTDIQIEKGSTATAYAPYSNICPITGHTAVAVARTGINLLDISHAVTGERFNANGTTSFGNNVRSEYIPVKPNTAYYFKNVRGLATMAPVWWYDKDKVNLSYANVGGTDPSSGVLTSPANAAYVGVNFAPAYTDSVAVNYPSTDTTYHPGHVQTVTLQLGQTVYGGELTVNEDGTGTLVVDRAIVDAENLTWSYDSNKNRWLSSTVSNIKPISGGTVLTTAISNSFKAYTNNQIYDNTALVGFAQNGAVFVVRNQASNATQPTGCSFVYELATPLTYALTASQVTTLLGTNNIWADAGDVAVSYRADTKTYVDGSVDDKQDKWETVFDSTLSEDVAELNVTLIKDARAIRIYCQAPIMDKNYSLQCYAQARTGSARHTFGTPNAFISSGARSSRCTFEIVGNAHIAINMTQFSNSDWYSSNANIAQSVQNINSNITSIARVRITRNQAGTIYDLPTGTRIVMEAMWA